MNQGSAPSGEPTLSALPFFAEVAHDLYASAQRCEYRDGDVILAAGAQPDRLLVLLRGTVGIHENGVRIVSRHPVCLVGELAFIDDQPRSASVIAEDAVVTYELTAAATRHLLADPVFLRNLTRELSGKLREATADRSFRYRSEELLFGAFTEHVSPEVRNELLETGADGTPRLADAVILFADVRGFSAKAHAMPVADLSEQLGRFIDFAVATVHAHGGMVDKFVGDAVMAVWGYAEGPDHADRALACAIDLVQRAGELMLDGEPIRVGVGIESGLVMLGVIGSNGKRQFTALGDAVNVAARLQSETKELGQPICLGPDVASRVSEDHRATLGGPHERTLRGIGLLQVWTHADTEGTAR